MTETRCDATRPGVRIGNQVEQTATCYRISGHDGWHTAVVLDSDDNAIIDRWVDHPGDGGAL